MKVERHEWNIVSKNQLPPIGEDILCCVDKDVCGAEQDFLSTDYLTQYTEFGEERLKFECYSNSVYAWVHLPKVFIPGETNDSDWNESTAPTKNGRYIVTVLIVEKDTGEESFMIDILDYNADNKDDPWDLINNYVASEDEDDDDDCEYSIIAYTDAPELYVRKTQSRVKNMMNNENDLREEIYSLVGFINPYIKPEDIKQRIDDWLDDKVPIE